ncbi:MAG: cyclase family protein [Christensenellales bacterium]
MELYDISMGIFHDMPVYKGKDEKRPALKADANFTSGTVLETRLEMNMHTGTHIDMPLHMLKGGSTVDTLDLKKVVTRCKVFDLTGAEGQVSQEHLQEKNIAEGDFILLKTKNSYLNILENEYIYLDKTGAQYLKDKGIIGVGIDSLGIERNQPGHETHTILLGAGIIIIEGLKLKDIEEGDYLLVAAPINVVGAEAAPLRALLIK